MFWTMYDLTRVRGKPLVCRVRTGGTGNRWLPDTRMPSCDHCGSHVSDRFARVFADKHGRLLACPNCSANAGIAEVARRRTRTA